VAQFFGLTAGLLKKIAENATDAANTGKLEDQYRRI